MKHQLSLSRSAFENKRMMIRTIFWLGLHLLMPPFDFPMMTGERNWNDLGGIVGSGDKRRENLILTIFMFGEGQNV